MYNVDSHGKSGRGDWSGRVRFEVGWGYGSIVVSLLLFWVTSCATTRFLLSKELTSPLPHLLLILTDKKGMMLSDELEPRDTAHEIKVMYCQDCVRSVVNVKLYFLCVIEVT